MSELHRRVIDAVAYGYNATKQHYVDGLPDDYRVHVLVVLPLGDLRDLAGRASKDNVTVLSGG